jgi:hypothetical protein
MSMMERNNGILLSPAESLGLYSCILVSCHLRSQQTWIEHTSLSYERTLV